MNQLIGGENDFIEEGVNRNNVNADGFFIPQGMRNYQEQVVLGGLVTFKACNRMDLFWGRAKDLERDFVYLHLFVIGWALLLLVYVLIRGGEESKYKGNF